GAVGHDDVATDDADKSAPRTLIGPLVPRFAEVAFAVIIGLFVRKHYPRAEELGGVLTFLALTGVTLLSGWWSLVAGFKPLVLFASWRRIPLLWASPRRWLWWARAAVEFGNRWLAHIDALLAWVTLAVVWGKRIEVQIPLVVAIVRLGPRLVDMLAALS